MTEQTERFQWVAKLAFAAMIATLVAVGIAFIITAAYFIINVIEEPKMESLAKLALLAAGELAVAAWVLLIYGSAKVVVSNEATISKTSAVLDRVQSLLQSQTDSCKRLIELASLSDKAKSLIFRDKEIEAFREIIHEDLLRQDYDTAKKLIDAIEETFGYADEAMRLREDVESYRQSSVEEKIDVAVDRITTIIDSRDWTRAAREVKRIVDIFPTNEKVAALPQKLEAAKSAHKRELIQKYDNAVKKNDVDLSIALLKELDKYLSPQEAAALEESARGIFRTKLHNLGVQFALFVTDEQWAKAVATGEEIVNEFPNSRMAQEVREKMSQLQAKATEAEILAATGALPTAAERPVLTPRPETPK